MGQAAPAGSPEWPPFWRRSLRLDTPVGPLHPGDPHLRVAFAQLAAVAAILVTTVLQRGGLAGEQQLPVAVVIASGISFLHVVTAGQRLVRSTVVLDAVATATLLAGMGAPTSPFYALALAGTWWAAQVPGRRRALTYALALSVAYALLVVPHAFRQHLLAEAFEDIAVLVIVAALSDWFVRVDERALELNEALTVPPFGAEQLAIREGLLRALRTMDIPVDVVLAAGQVGLTAVQAELLAYLVLGLTNVETSDAVGLSEATIRYRLTRLYRALGVRGRKEAAARARALGLSQSRTSPRAEPMSVADLP